jgi:small subunit ribosomal protein S16
MLKIRFQRQGRKKSPFYRVVVAEHSKPVNGRFVEIIGFHNPLSKETSLKSERLVYWLEKGAQPSDRVARLAVKQGVSQCEKYIKERILKPSKAEVEAQKAKAEEAEKAAEAREAAKAEAEAQKKAQAEAEDSNNEEPQTPQESEKPTDESKPAA